MEFTRKSFLSGAAIGLAGLTFFPTEAFAALPEGPDGPGVALRRAVGETFYAEGARGVLVPLGLERSVDVRSDALSEQFSLYFTVGEKYSLKEGTWRLVSSNGRREYDVFLVPAGTNPAGEPLYRADFCLLKGVVSSVARR
jgi:hypothetical protein